jgi:hypothetical protein
MLSMNLRMWLVAALALTGCKKEDRPAAGTRTAGAQAAPALLPIGSADPFAPLSVEARKALTRGLKASHAKKWDEARAELERAVSLAPDDAQTLWALLVATSHTKDLAPVPALCEKLAALDLSAYTTRFATSKPLAALRKTPEGARCDELGRRYREVWARGWDHGFFLVARRVGAREPSFGAGNEAALDPAQEVYFYELPTRRFRRLTDTDGHAFALQRSNDGKRLSVLIVGRLHREHNVDSFVDPKIETFDLATVESVGPFVMKGVYDQVVLGENAAGQPLFSFTVGTGATQTYTIDTAKTGLAPLEGAAVVPVGAETRAWPNQVARVAGKPLDDVHVTDGANQLVLAIPPQPITITAARPIAQSSVRWSPGHQKITYAGKLDPCRAAQPGATEKNELYVYDLPKRSAQRVAAGLSQFETLWLDDDQLVYEGGVGRAGQLHLYAFDAHADTALPTRHGAGLYGVPTLACEQAETGVDEDLGEIDEEGD